MTCAKCGVNPGSRPMAAGDWCEECWLAFRDDVLNRIIIESPSVLAQCGLVRPEHGPGMADVECMACGATLVDIALTVCPYCEASWERMAHWQAEKLLRTELPDPDDARYPNAIAAWVERLTVALRAGLITETQMRAVWERRVVAVAAA